MICEFVTTKGCRRRVMSLYLDNKEIECGGDTSMAKCDGCGEGLTALERSYVRAATERQVVEETLDELSDGCVVCFVESADEPDIDWQHEKEQCLQQEQQEQQRGQNNNDEGGPGENRADLEKFRESIRFEARSHSCFKCGLSQRLCRTGQDSKETCQWPNVMTAMVKRTPLTRSGAAILHKIGFRGDLSDRSEYARWLGLRHERRVWGELMSNATVLIIELIVWVREQGTTSGRSRNEEGDEDDEHEGARQTETEFRVERESAQEGRHQDDERGGMKRPVEDDVGASGGAGGRLRRFITKLNRWKGVCLVCKAAVGWEIRDHTFNDCARDEFATEMMKRGANQMRAMEEPRGEQGKCWVGWQRCEKEEAGEKEGCRFSRLAREVAIALLYVSSRAEEVQAWIEEDGNLLREVERDGQKALEGFLKGAADWDGIESNRLCELIWRFG